MSISVLLAFSAHAADGGLDVPLGSGPADVVSLVPARALMRQLDGGVEVVDQIACMAPDTAQALDLGLRTAESERDQLRITVALTTAVGAAMTIAVAVLTAAYATKK